MNRWIDQQLGDPTVQRGMAVIGELVRRGRRGAGITQQRLADAAGMHQATISRLERGELRAMRLVRLARVIGALVELGGLPLPEDPPGTKARRIGLLLAATGPHRSGGPSRTAVMPSTRMAERNTTPPANPTHI